MSWAARAAHNRDLVEASALPADDIIANDSLGSNDPSNASTGVAAASLRRIPMEITVSTQTGRVPVTVVQPHGDIDASNYTELVSRVEELMKGGAQDFLIDLSDVPFLSSAGLVALHSLAITLRGEKPADPTAGWATLKSMDRSRARGIQEHIKLLSPQPNVADTFDKAGFTQFFAIFTDLKQAVASF
jgi:anti-anti-sigma factor